MPDATHDTLREQLLEEVGKNDDFRIAYLEDASFYHGVNVAIRAAEEHERLLRERIKALPEGLRKGDVRLADVLAVFSPPDPYDEPMIGGPHEVTNQYHSEPSRDPRQR